MEGVLGATVVGLKLSVYMASTYLSASYHKFYLWPDFEKCTDNLKVNLK